MTFWSPSCLSVGSCQYSELEYHIAVHNQFLKNSIPSLSLTSLAGFPVFSWGCQYIKSPGQSSWFEDLCEVVRVMVSVPSFFCE